MKRNNIKMIGLTYIGVGEGMNIKITRALSGVKEYAMTEARMYRLSNVMGNPSVKLYGFGGAAVLFSVEPRPNKPQPAGWIANDPEAVGKRVADGVDCDCWMARDKDGNQVQAQCEYCA